jgi:hypothetical protein
MSEKSPSVFTFDDKVRLQYHFASNLLVIYNRNRNRQRGICNALRIAALNSLGRLLRSAGLNSVALRLVQLRSQGGRTEVLSQERVLVLTSTLALIAFE